MMTTNSARSSTTCGRSPSPSRTATCRSPPNACGKRRRLLREGLENSASDEEIARLTQELREAMQEFMQALAQEAMRNPDMANLPPDANTQTLRSQDLERMLDQIEELARHWRPRRRAAASQPAPEHDGEPAGRPRAGRPAAEPDDGEPEPSSAT